MLLYKVIFFVVSVTYAKETQMQIIVQLLKQFFTNHSRLLYQYDQFTNMDDTLLKVSKQSFYVASNSLNKLPQDLDGYIFDLSTTGVLVSILSKIKPYTRAMIVYNSTETSPIGSFMQKLYYRSVDAIALDIKDSNSIKVTFNDKRSDIIIKTEQQNLEPIFFKPWKPIFPRPFRVSLFNCSPFVIFDENNEPTTGIELNFIKYITKDFPLVYLKINASGNSAFAKVRKTVVTKDADLGVCALWMVKQDLHELDTLTTIFPHDSLCATFLVPKPYPYIGFLNPFLALSKHLWLAIFISVLLIYIIILILNWIFYKKTINKSAVFLNIIRILSSGSIPSKKHSVLKKLLLSWSLTCMILTASYSAGITSTMNVPKYTKSIRFFNDIVEEQLKLIGTPKSIYDICKNSKNPILTKLKDYFITNENKITKHEPFGLFVKRIQGYYVMNAEKLNEEQRYRYHILNECIMNIYLTLMVAKNSPFKRIFDRQSILLQQHGIIQAWKRNLTISGRFNYMRNFFIVDERSYDYKVLSLNEIKGAFLFLLCGFVLSLLVFLIEIRVWNFNQ